MKQLLEQTTLKRLRESLTRFPNAFFSLYYDEIERRFEDGPDRPDLARISLAFLSNADRPLTFDELELNVSISQGEDSDDPEARVPIDIILSTCSDMVVVDYVEETVKVAHHTIRTFTQQEILPEYSVGHDALEAVYPPNQIVRLFVGDDALLDLVGKVLDTAFLGCFEQKFSMLLKTYANRLKEEAKSPSQESAAILTGAWTRQIAERLRLAVRPVNFQDQEGGVFAGNSKEKEAPVLDALIESAEATSETDQNNVEEKSGDRASSVTTINFMGLREFMLATGPFVDLKAAIAHQVDINSLANSETASLEKSTKGNQSKDAGRDRSAQLQDKIHALMIGAPAILHKLVIPRNWTTTRWRHFRYRMLRSRILNWLDVCKEVFFRRIPDERLGIKHFQWTCVSHRSHYKGLTIQVSLYHYRAAGVSSKKV